MRVPEKNTGKIKKSSTNWECRPSQASGYLYNMYTSLYNRKYPYKYTGLYIYIYTALAVAAWTPPKRTARAVHLRQDLFHRIAVELVPENLAAVRRHRLARCVGKGSQHPTASRRWGQDGQ